ncbi:MAG: class I SAM-dependent methyltransferase [Candidatus Thorarchaeota archaeon]
MSNISFSVIDRDIVRRNLNKYTRKAFQMLSALDKPKILDIGCGTGVPTMELGRLTDGQIMGIDINPELLEKLKGKIAKAGQADQIKTVQCSLMELNFEEESFDIIWSEGSIWVIGFEKGLKEWKRFLKPNGFLVVHDEAKEFEKKLKLISNYDYQLIGHFQLDEDVWRSEYYEPLERIVNEKLIEYKNDNKALQVLDKEQQEIRSFKKDSRQFTSAFFIMQKR